MKPQHKERCQQKKKQKNQEKLLTETEAEKIFPLDECCDKVGQGKKVNKPCHVLYFKLHLLQKIPRVKEINYINLLRTFQTKVWLFFFF